MGIMLTDSVNPMGRVDRQSILPLLHKLFKHKVKWQPEKQPACIRQYTFPQNSRYNFDISSIKLIEEISKKYRSFIEVISNK
jgi:hypothetical protein